MKKLDAQKNKLYTLAKKTQKNAHAPYSKFKVGAALLTHDGNMYAGCNVENASFGATVCAERTAIQTAVAAQGYFEIREIVVVTNSTPPWPPCALCRQVISEFIGNSGRSLKIHAMNLKGKSVEYTFDELYPDSFTPKDLK